MISAIHNCGEFTIIKAKWDIAKTARREDSGSIPGTTTKPSLEGFLLTKYWGIHTATPRKKHLTKLAEAALHKLRKAAKLLGLVLFINTVK